MRKLHYPISAVLLLGTAFTASAAPVTLARGGQATATIVTPANAAAPIEQCTVQAWDRIMAVNARGVFLGTKHAIAPMRAGGGGSIINVSSIAALGQGALMEVAYAASKGAVRTFTKAIAAQYAHEGIRCNSVHPGPIDGGMLRGLLSDPAKLQRRLARVPMGRLGRVDEVVAGVMFLASDAAGYVTGQVVAVDGGYLAHF